MNGEQRALLALGAGLALVVTAPALGVGAEVAAFVDARPGVVARVEAAMGPVCHHIPERTPAVSGRALPVCARCVGLYAGVGTGGAIGIAVGGIVGTRPRWLAWVAGGTAALTVAAGLAAVLEALGLVATGNGLRVALGVPLGLGPTLLGGLGARALMAAARG